MRWEVFFDLPTKQTRLEELEKQVADSNFWNDNEAAAVTLKERSDLSAEVERIEKLFSQFADCEALFDLLRESEEADLSAECVSEFNVFEGVLKDFELGRMLAGAHDSADAILEINSGAGGTEAQDWAEMLLRMYLRWAEKRGFETQILSIQAGEEAGVKHVTVLIRGANCFGYLRSERGVHRLVRISPFDSNARRHTSFASVAATPDIEEDVEIEIRDEDLRVDTYRASGAGGQHINKTDSAVRLTHIPSGIVVACQNERSQHKNKAFAMRLLKAKLYDIEVQKQKEEISKISGERRKIDFGSQIRSYVMQPYQMVKDLRTGVEVGNVQAVLDGSIDEFIRGYLLSDEFNDELAISK